MQKWKVLCDSCILQYVLSSVSEHESLVSQEMRNAIQSDRSIIHILEISELGLMELTRRRVRALSHVANFCVDCYVNWNNESLHGNMRCYM
jgi:Ribonuclease G/E